jgi:NADPH:quinone reductase
MKAIGIAEFGGPEVLRVVERPEPHPGVGEVRIRVHAVAVNPTDLGFRSGIRASQLEDRQPPYIPGMDASGVIDELGAGTAERFSLGDRVMAIVVPTGSHGGTYAEQIVVSADSVVGAPVGASFAEASAVLLNALAARLALNALGLKRGQLLAVTGAAGVLGGFAIQLAKADGLDVLADAGSDDESLVLSLGADHVVRRGDDVAIRMRALIPEGVQGVIDGANLDALILPAIANGGGLATVRGWAGPVERDITLHRIASFAAVTNTAMLEDVRARVEDGTLTIRVADVLSARDAAEAHHRLEAGGVRGRLVLDFSSPLDSV